MASGNFLLEHFYYGQPVRDGKPEGELQLLASSPGVDTEQVAEAVSQALLPPLVNSPQGAWALVRGKKAAPFILAQSQLGAAGQTMLHYALPSPDMLRALGGNLKALARLVEESLPAYDRPGNSLKPLSLPPAEAPSAETQIDDILTLMTYTQNRIDTIEALVAAIVQGVLLVITGAPLELEPRIQFVQGLLALLPPSARFGVTFTTHSLLSTRMDTQVRFFAGDTLPEDATIFNWSDAQLSGQRVEDGYSRFICSQLRLDSQRVIDQTRNLTAVAAWRIRRGDRLADALGYAAYRFKIDDSLLNNQPVEIADVSRVLTEDPTLTEDLKITYARHLLAFALALGEMQQAEPIAIILRQQPQLEAAVQQQFSDALQEGKAGLIYETLGRWLSNPLGPVGTGWVEVAHRAALMQMDTVVKARDAKAVHRLLESVHHATPGIEVSRIVPKLIEMALPIAVRDEDLSLTLFLLAVNYLENDSLRALMRSKRLAAKLPLSLSRLVPYLARTDAGIAPSGLLIDTATAFGDEWRDLVLIRLSEAAVLAERPDIVDTPALAGLVGTLAGPTGKQYNQTLRWIAKNVGQDDSLLQQLDDPGPTYLLQILLATGAYADLAAEMLHQARVLYPGDKQAQYVVAVRRIFAETPINTEDIPVALKTIGDLGIKMLPLAMAYIGALEGHEWSSALDPVAEEVTTMVLENATILELIHPTAMIALLKFHIKRKDVPNTIKVAGAISKVAARDEGSKGINIIGRMYKLMDWDDRVRQAGMELLRRFVRYAKDEDSRRAINVFGREFGAKVQQALEGTYALKRLMDNVELVEYAEFLHNAAGFLYDTAVAYADKDRLPSVGAILNNLDSMPGGLTDEDRKVIVRELLSLGKAAVVLGDHAHANRPRDLNKHIEQLMTGQANPVTALDVLLVMSGYLTKGKRYPLRLNTVSVRHPLGERSAPSLRDDIQITNGLLRGAVRAFPLEKKLNISSEMIRSEMESLWGGISLAKQREIVRDLAVDLQRVAELTSLVAEQGNEKALEENALARKLEEGKQQPKNTLEFYRTMYGYYRARIK